MDLWAFVGEVWSILRIRCAFLSVRASLYASTAMLV